MRVHANKVRLTKEEKKQIEEVFKKGMHSAQKIKRAKILLELDSLSRSSISLKYRPTIKSIAAKCGVNETTVYTVEKQYMEQGLKSTLTRKKRETPPIKPIITGDIEARIIALACSEPPKGRTRWTLRLLESKVIELGIMEKVSDNTIGRMLKKRR
jgi:transposase-like protein